MPEFDENELNHLMKLCRIECSSEEKQTLKDNLAKVLNYIQLLQEVDTEGVKPCLSVQESLVNVTREDKVENTLSREDFLANAPIHVGGMIRVPPVIKFANP